MRNPPDNRFDTLESAYQYIVILAEVLEETRSAIEADIELARVDRTAARRLDALQLVDYKLDRLRSHLDGSRRLLNDLRMLRRVLQVEGVPDEEISTTV